MGSGHILVYAFDVLIQIYKKCGVSERDAAQSILQYNLYGLDIDDRAAQLAYFAVMMKARQYDRRIFSRGIQPHLYAIVESNELDSNTIDYFTNNDPKLKQDFGTLVDELRDAKEYGSILNITPVDFAALYARVEEVREDISLYRGNVLNMVLPLIRVAEVMAQKYDVVVTNPPYMGSSNMDAKLNAFVKKHYPNSKSDLFACFIEKGNKMVGNARYNCMVTMQSWMFLSSFEKMRTQILKSYDIVTLMHMENMVLGIAFGTAVTVFRNQYISGYKGTYNQIKLCDVEDGKPVEFPVAGNRFAQASADNFSKIPGSPVAYWVSEKFISTFEKGISIDSISDYTGSQNITADNDRFLRFIWEVSANKIGKHHYWAFYIKGGLFRKWYGNIELIINWSTEAQHFYKTNPTSNLLGERYRFKEGITYTELTSAVNSFRYLPPIAIFDKKGPCIVNVNHNLYCLAFFNTKLAAEYFKLLNPTITLQVKDIKNTPLIICDRKIEEVEKITEECVDISRFDWDSYETSWDFQCHPLIRLQLAGAYAWGDKPPVMRLSPAYKAWKLECEGRFEKLKANEEELNRIFIDIYGLQDELTSGVADKDVTVHRIFDTKDDVPESMQGSNYVRTKRDEIVSLISYAVGCMFGRYSVYKDGLLFAGEPYSLQAFVDKLNEKPGTVPASEISRAYRNEGVNIEEMFFPDEDNIIPICDDDYFDDDITGRFVKWVEIVYSSETLEENLKFIADALGGKGTSREVIRSYFLNDFFKDHCKTYQKRPIYWLFDSGKKNGFKALIYMHRYQSDLLARMRTDYVHEQQERYRTQMDHISDALEHVSGAERVKLTKRQKKIQDQMLEIQKYEEKIHHLADQNISIDLDDGVKRNYALFADVLAKIK